MSNRVHFTLRIERIKLTTEDLIGTYHPYLTIVEGLKLLRPELYPGREAALVLRGLRACE